MATYKTPGVYVEEIATFPPSVAEVSTAIPAFIGYTEKAAKPVARINSMLEYETLFGKAPPSKFTIKTRTNAATRLPEVTAVARDAAATEAKFLLYYTLSLYFKNGGGSCYVISVGDYSKAPDKANFRSGLAELAKEDEPTLILLTDASNLAAADYYELCQGALNQCGKLRDRFAILDVLAGDDKVAEFREKIAGDNLKYGAAYHPYLQTSLNYQYREEDVTIESDSAPSANATSSTWQKVFGDKGILVRYSSASTDTPKVKIQAAGEPISFAVTARMLTISGVADKTGTDVITAWSDWKANPNDPQGFDISLNGDGSGAVGTTSATGQNLELQSTPTTAPTTTTLAAIATSNTALYNQIKTALTDQRVVLPPSPAIAGIYASVDRNRGVWKAPANVGLSAVIGPVAKITQEEQESLNIDPAAGKSINAIRAFTGKGTLVWGARTLAGNDNEWRYISVRRLFNLIEESIQKSTAFAVFEPNDAATWLKVKAMIESYLYGLWQQGALAGSTPAAAYFVNVGLGRTMTPQDVLEGRMIVEVGVAAVRPAEYIILRFSHKMQEA
jgi:hypothetical protein